MNVDIKIKDLNELKNKVEKEKIYIKFILFFVALIGIIYIFKSMFLTTIACITFFYISPILRVYAYNKVIEKDNLSNNKNIKKIKEYDNYLFQNHIIILMIALALFVYHFNTAQIYIDTVYFYKLEDFKDVYGYMISENSIIKGIKHNFYKESFFDYLIALSWVVFTLFPFYCIVMSVYTYKRFKETNEILLDIINQEK